MLRRAERWKIDLLRLSDLDGVELGKKVKQPVTPTTAVINYFLPRHNWSKCVYIV